MIPLLDKKSNVGIILMLSGIMLLSAGIAGFFIDNSTDMTGTCIANIITGEITFFVGYGICRQRPYAHFLHLFDDCESRIGVVCSISAAFGLAFLIDGIFAIAIKDSLNTIGNVVSGLALLIAPAILINYKGSTASRVAHVIMCVFSALTFLMLFIIAALFAWESDIEGCVECAFDIIVLFIVIIYIFDESVKSEIWGEHSTARSNSGSL